jgi:hypothetical protein
VGGRGEGRRMKSKRTAACLAVLGALCVPAVAAAPASAALPEYGHCTAVAGGKFSGPTCTTFGTTPKTMKFEFKAIEATEGIEGGGVGSTIRVLTSGHPTLICGSLSIVSKWTGPKTAAVKWILTECHNVINQTCQSGTTAGEIQANPLEGELGYIKSVPPQLVGLDMKPQTPLTSLFSYMCGASLETATVEGSVIARIKPINKMSREQNIYISAPKGEQFPQSFEGGPTDTLSTTYQPANTTAPSLMSVKTFVGSTTALNGNPEVELKALE